MADPSNFVNFSDFMGLNEEAGQQMSDRLSGYGAKYEGEADAAGEEQRRAALRGDKAGFEAAGVKAKAATASYARFAKALKDPAARQQLMEEIYGKGKVSALDSSLTGGRDYSSVDAAASGVEGRRSANESRWGNRMSMDVEAKTAEADDNARRAASLEDHRGRMKARDAADRDRAVDSYARQFDPNYQGNNAQRFDSYGFIDGLIGRKRPEGTQRDYWARQLGRAESTPSMDQSMNTGSPGNPANGFNAGEQGNTPQGQNSNIGAYSKSKRWVVGSDGAGRWVGDKKLGDKFGDVRDLYDPNRIKKWGEQ